MYYFRTGTMAASDTVLQRLEQRAAQAELFIEQLRSQLAGLKKAAGTDPFHIIMFFFKVLMPIVNIKID